MENVLLIDEADIRPKHDDFRSETYRKVASFIKQVRNHRGLKE